MKYSLLFALYLVVNTSSLFAQAKLDREGALKAFELLKDIRTNPQKYSAEMKFLKSAKISSTQLKWNDTLAKVAQEKAIDMAKRNYFSHTNPNGNGINILMLKKGYKLNADWVKVKSTNYFESISSGNNSAEEGIKRLIIDENEPKLGHRIHLLGLDDWNASLQDVGIAFVTPEGKTQYKSYMVVIIAKHDW